MAKSLWIRLVLPLGILSIATLLLSIYFQKPFDFSSLLINLSTDFFMIIVTVLYVDWVIRSSEEKQWESVQMQITSRIRAWIVDCVAFLFSPIGLFESITGEPPPSTAELQAQVWTDTARRLVEDRHFENKVKEISDEDWDQLIKNLQDVRKEAFRLLDVFGSKISPMQISYIMDIESDITWILNTRNYYRIIAANDEPETPYDTGWVWEWSEQCSPEIISHLSSAAKKLWNLLLTIQSESSFARHD